MMRTTTLFAALAIAVSISACKQTPFEEQSTAKKLNTLKRTSATDPQWTRAWAGKQVYEQYCSGCHGLKGDGKGVAASMLETKPRNFARGMF